MSATEKLAPAREEVPVPSAELMITAGQGSTSFVDLDTIWAHCKGYGPTFVVEGLVMLTFVIVFKLAALFLGKDGFSEYALSRRVISLIQPLLLVGMAVGVPRYVGFAKGREEKVRARRFLSAALLAVASVVCVFSLIAIVGQHLFAYLIYGGEKYSNLILPLVPISCGLCLHSIVYGYLRGEFRIGTANCLQFVNLVMVPLSVFAFRPLSCAALLWMLGTGWTVVSSISLLLTPFRKFEFPRGELKELLGYGLQRVPGDFLFVGLLGLPPIVVAHLSGVRDAGIVAMGISLANMIAAFFYPVGVILLPKISSRLSSGRFAELHHEIKLIAVVSILLPAALVVLLELFAGYLVRFYLGSELPSSTMTVRIAVLGGVPLAIYCSLRTVIDAVYKRAVNTINLYYSMALFLVTLVASYWLFKSYKVVLPAFLCGVSLLAILTLLEIVKILKNSDRSEVVATDMEYDSLVAVKE